MTNTKALDALIMAVDAGEEYIERDIQNALGGYRQSEVSRMVMQAYHGSLDAAKALHEALLPGCSQYSVVTDPTCIRANAVWWPDGLAAGRECHGEGWSEDNEARARLLATIKAYRASL